MSLGWAPCDAVSLTVETNFVWLQNTTDWKALGKVPAYRARSYTIECDFDLG
jgi:hypothetical protein